MSDLQIGLIALGVLLILLVLGFNWWQDRRVRRKMQTHFPSTEQDPLLGAGAHSGTTAGRSEGGALSQCGRSLGGTCRCRVTPAGAHPASPRSGEPACVAPSPRAVR